MSEFCSLWSDVAAWPTSSIAGNVPAPNASITKAPLIALPDTADQVKVE